MQMVSVGPQVCVTCPVTLSHAISSEVQQEAIVFLISGSAPDLYDGGSLANTDHLSNQQVW